MEYRSHDVAPGIMLHENLARRDDIVGPSNRRFGLSIGAACAAIWGVRWLLGHKHSEWLLAIALLAALFAIIWPAALAPFSRLWLNSGSYLNGSLTPLS